jgi:hypothetical protein
MVSNRPTIKSMPRGQICHRCKGTINNTRYNTCSCDRKTKSNNNFHTNASRACDQSNFPITRKRFHNYSMSCIILDEEEDVEDEN